MSKYGPNCCVFCANANVCIKWKGIEVDIRNLKLQGLKKLGRRKQRGMGEAEQCIKYIETRLDTEYDNAIKMFKDLDIDLESIWKGKSND